MKTRSSEQLIKRVQILDFMNAKYCIKMIRVIYLHNHYPKILEKSYYYKTQKKYQEWKVNRYFYNSFQSKKFIMRLRKKTKKKKRKKKKMTIILTKNLRVVLLIKMNYWYLIINKLEGNLNFTQVTKVGVQGKNKKKILLLLKREKA